MKNYMQIEPVRTLSAILALGSAIIGALALGLDWSGEMVAAVGLVWSAFVGVFASFFPKGTREQVKPVDSP